MMIPTIYIDGIDRTGKTTLIAYLRSLGGWGVIPVDRGPMTYCIKSGKTEEECMGVYGEYSDAICVFLRCEKPDWNIRCALTNEFTPPYESLVQMWDRQLELARKCGMKVLEYNTSNITIYNVAKDIVLKLKEN